MEKGGKKSIKISASVTDGSSYVHCVIFFFSACVYRRMNYGTPRYCQVVGGRGEYFNELGARVWKENCKIL